MDDDKMEFGEWVGRGIGILITAIFLGVATVGFFLAGKYFAARGELYKEAGQEIRVLNTVDVVSPALEGALVHAVGNAVVWDKATDPLLGISAEAMCIHRDVHYYQWREEEPDNRRNDNESVRQPVYVQRWVDRPVDSSRFRLASAHRNNFVLARIGSLRSPAGKATLGLGVRSKSSISGSIDIP